MELTVDETLEKKRQWTWNIKRETIQREEENRRLKIKMNGASVTSVTCGIIQIIVAYV